MKLFSVLILLFSFTTIFSQAELAEFFYDSYEYDLAIKYYEECEFLQKEDVKKLALSFYYIQDYKNAKSIYDQIAAAKELDSQDSLLYAESLKNQNELDKAVKFLPKIWPTSYEEELVADLKKEIEFLRTYNKTDKDVVASLFNLNKINTSSANLYLKPYKNGAFYLSESIGNDKSLVIKTLDTISQAEELAYGTKLRPQTKLYYFTDEGGKQEVVMPEDFHIGAYSADSVNHVIYFTRTDFAKKWAKYKQYPTLWIGDLDDQNFRVTNLREVEFDSIKGDFASGHLTLVPDTNIVFFSAYLEGGKGGFDIYSGEIDNGKISNVMNLGSNINTSGDEIFPMFTDSSSLYYASNGQPGFGNLDIYKVILKNYKVYNKSTILPKPFNSPADDFCFVYKENSSSQGFLTSNRAKGKGDDDIYYFKLGYQIIQGIVRDADGNPVVGALVQLLDKDGDVIDETYTDENGHYEFEVLPGEYEVLIRTADGYIARHKVNVDENWDGNKSIDLTLVKDTEEHEIKSYVTDLKTGDAIAGATIETYKKEGGEWVLKESSTSDDNGKWKTNLKRDEDQKIVIKHGFYKRKEVEILSDDPNRGTIVNELLLGVELEKSTISGTLLDEITGKPIAGALIEIFEKQADGSYIKVGETYTDENGNWELAIDNSKEYRVDVSRDGYETYSIDIPVLNDLSKEDYDKLMNKISNIKLSTAIEVGNEVNLDNIYFDYGQADIQEASYEIMDNMVKFLKKNLTVKIELSAHTDCSGGSSYNQKLSERRAKSCQKYLVQQGIEKSRIIAVGYGESKPLVDCEIQMSDPVEAQKNRRVNMKILEISSF